MRGIGYIVIDDIATDRDIFILTKDYERIGYTDRESLLAARKACANDHETYDDPVIFRYFKNIELHPSQYTIERISA